MLLAAIGLGFAAQASPAQRRPPATLRVTKRVVAQPGVTDPGRFDIRANGRAATTASNVGDGGTTGTVVVPAGPYVISESARPGTSLADYSAAVSCRDTASGHTATASASAGVLAIMVSAGDAWDCTITNTRRYAALALAKTGPATAMAGTAVPYVLTAANIGTVSFPLGRVSVSDPQCVAPGPVLRSVNGDATPATLDPGDRWTYGCQVSTTTSQTRVDNVAGVTATDLAGRTASATAQLSTALTPAADEQPASVVQQVAPVALRSGRATLYGPRGCPVTATTAFVKGRRILRVIYYVDGRRVRTLTHPNRAGHFTLRLKLRGLGTGPHRLSARIQFAGDSNTRTQTLRLSFVRCRAGAVTPSFTG
ncbi:MAG: hypothetical protein ABI950_13140 [Solirubrobacteraceae bacterium]